MASQYAYSSPEFEYQAEVLKKQMQSTKANFAYLRFKKSMLMQLSGFDNKD